jgi:hypothetical protein
MKGSEVAMRRKCLSLSKQRSMRLRSRMIATRVLLAGITAFAPRLAIRLRKPLLL